MREHEAFSRKEGKQREFQIYMFGRGGGLKEDLKRNDLLYPTGLVHKGCLEKKISFENILADNNGIQGANYNVGTVINQTVEELQKATKKGDAVSVDMECFSLWLAAQNALLNYNEAIKNIDIGIALYVSDLPLKGDTLAEELDSDKGEKAAVKQILKNI